VRLVACLVLVD